MKGYFPEFLAAPTGIHAEWGIKVNNRWKAEWPPASAMKLLADEIIDKHCIALDLQV